MKKKKKLRNTCTRKIYIDKIDGIMCCVPDACILYDFLNKLDSSCIITDDCINLIHTLQIASYKHNFYTDHSDSNFENKLKMFIKNDAHSKKVLYIPLFSIMKSTVEMLGLKVRDSN